MNDFENTNAKKDEEMNEEYVESTAREITEEEEQPIQEKEMEMAEENLSRPSVREYCYEEQVKKKPKRKRGILKFVVGCLLIGGAMGFGMGAGYGVTKQYLKEPGAIQTTPLPVQKNGVSSGFSPRAIIKAVRPSVVSVSTTISGRTQYFGAFSIPYEAEGAGSGVIFFSDDTRVAIATNNHVIENADTIYVTFEGDISVPAKVIGTKSESDLAVLTVSWADLHEAGIEQVVTATFGDSDAMEVGDEVFAIGNAMGMGLSATDGIISMKEQSIEVEGNALPVLQTSAAINSGNSGGALVNAAGEVIGINTAKYNSAMVEGMGYAIPSNLITPIVEELLEVGTMPKPYMGITGTSITQENASLYKLPVGALIMEVTENSPADKAGIEVGDIVTEFDGKTVMDMDALAEFVNTTEIGKTVSVHVVREEQGLDLQLKIEDKNK